MNKTTLRTIRNTVILAALMLPAFASAESYSGDGVGMEGVKSVQIVALERIDVQKAKETLATSLDQLETHFLTTRQKAAALQKLTENTGADIVQTIDGYLSQIKALKSRAAEAKTGIELKAVANDVHDLIMDAKFEVKKNIGTRVETRIDRFTEKNDEQKALFERARNRVEKMRPEGKVPQDLEKNLESCRTLMLQGEQNLKDAKSKLVEMKTLPRTQREQGVKLMNESIKNVQNARMTYGQARQNCPKVMKEIRGLK